MDKTRKTCRLSGLSLLMVGLGAQAQDEPTMVILPDAAADRASVVTQDIVLPDEAVEGMAAAEANHGEAPSAALEALADAQAQAADAADDGLQTAMDAVEGARENLARANLPDGLPDQVPEDLPAAPEDTVPEGTESPLPPAVPTPPFGG